jgi:tRNA(fMet)-specific endonuclease VapC
MSQTLLLDTVAAIGFLNDDTDLIASLTGTEQASIPIIVAGELYAGAEKSSKATENRTRIDDFISRRQLLIADQETARVYGRIVLQLRQKGRPIPQNEMWIAALALQHDLIVLTRDAHFQAVDNLRLRGW